MPLDLSELNSNVLVVLSVGAAVFHIYVGIKLWKWLNSAL